MDRRYIFFFLLAAVLLALLLSPFASPWPDGLERVAENKGFLEKSEVKPALRSPVPDYLMPGIKNERLATAVAGVLGTLLVFAAGWVTALLLRRIAKNRKPDAPPLS